MKTQGLVRNMNRKNMADDEGISLDDPVPFSVVNLDCPIEFELTGEKPSEEVLPDEECECCPKEEEIDISKYLHFVFHCASVARKRKGLAGPLEGTSEFDAAMDGLLDAQRDFDPDFGVKFISFAALKIAGRLSHLYTMEKIRKHINFVQFSQFVGNRDNDNTDQWFDVVDHRGNFDRPFLRARTQEVIEVILEMIPSERRRSIMRMRFLDEMTLEEIGQKHQLTRERIRQIVDRCLQQLQVRAKHSQKLSEMLTS